MSEKLRELIAKDDVLDILDVLIPEDADVNHPVHVAYQQVTALTEKPAPAPASREVLLNVTNAFMWSLSESNDIIDDGAGNWHCIHCDSLGAGASFDHAPNCMYIKGMKALHAARKFLADTAAPPYAERPQLSAEQVMTAEVEWQKDLRGISRYEFTANWLDRPLTGVAKPPLVNQMRPGYHCGKGEKFDARDSANA